VADFVPTRPVKDELTSTGAQFRFYRMLGDAGANAVGFSEWREVQRMQKMTFQMYAAGADQTADISAAVFEIQGAMEKDADNPDTETDYAVLGTINNANRVVTIDDNVRHVRIEMTTAPASNVQVGMQTFGV
jgi:hypothetical protein